MSSPDGTQGTVAERFSAARPGWTLAACTEVALPYWRVRTRVRLMAHKRLGPIEEYALRAISAGIVNAEQVGEFLGLGEALCDATIVALLSRELLRWQGEELELTNSGNEVLTDCTVIRAEVRTVEIEWDGLLRRPVAALSAFLEPRNVRARGVREIPPSPSTGPDAEEMRSHLREIETLLRQLADGRGDEFDLLDIGGIERRFRMFRPAYALVYERDGAKDIQVGLVVDGRISSEHEQAFATAGLPGRLGVGSKGLKSERRAIARVMKAASVKPNRELTPHAHADPLQVALSASGERLIIIGRELREAVLDDAFLDVIDDLLGKGVTVTLAWQGRARANNAYDQSAIKALRDLEGEGRDLTLGAARGGPNALISDGRLAVLTSHDYLGHRGGEARDLHDERGVLITDAAAVNALATHLLAGITPLKQDDHATSQSPRRQRAT